MNSKRVITALLSTLAVALALPALASAATRYASPTGSGAADTSAAANPCSLTDALASAQLHDGDEVVVGSGDYTLANGITVGAAVNVHGAAGSPPPRITGTGYYVLGFTNPAGRVSDLDLEYTGSLLALSMEGATAERLFVHATGASATAACWIGEATIRDSVCWNQGATGLVISKFGGTALAAHLRNVTAVSSGSTEFSFGIRLTGNADAQFTVDGRNVIAAGNDEKAADVRANASTNGTAVVSLASSAFDKISTESGGAVSVPGDGDNLAIDPSFVNAAGGDFHAAAGGPTINAGTVDALVGPLDLAGKTRVQGPAVDIGAYEVEEATPNPGGGGGTGGGSGGTTGGAGGSTGGTQNGGGTGGTKAPETSLLKVPAKLTHSLKARFRFASGGQSTGFECSLGQGRFRACATGE